MKKEVWDLIDQTRVIDKKIDKYYEGYLKELIEENKGIEEGVSYLVMPLGLHYEISAITLGLTKPGHILFLYTKESKETLERIIELLEIEKNKFEAYIVDDADPLDAYNIINNAFMEWEKPKSVYIDITGGTKAMSVATALAGVNIDAKFLYLTAENFIRVINRPEMGTEHLKILDNPIKLYGDFDANIALEHMEAYDYVSSSEIFKQLMNSALDIERRNYYRILFLLAAGYEHWDNLEFQEAYKCFDRMIDSINKVEKQYGQCVLADRVDDLKLQRGILKNLGFEFENTVNYDIVQDLDSILALIMTIYRSAYRRKEQEKYDMAVLLLYRLVEIIGQRRLAVNGINYEDPNFFNKLGERDYVDFKLRFNKLKNRVFNDHRTYKPPRRNITLMDGYIILGTINDALFREKDKEGYIQELYNFCKIRNQSIFAHGFKVIGKEHYDEFEEFVENLLKEFARHENIDLHAYESKVKFINPENTKYIK
ncbi:TIGR02710 family CRISPR-associated CARF protein [Vallitalea okinawensis]|uniref:TIGR02710 family CRISPR-associated CARF protein n=1 Tax=Vallitalea okinawensis TaxID=2078660 RepID=UPI000CFC9F72|nr:TIGR02710 family CRISPR-associated CARF protein [Vallitalea okinawensis]